MYHIRNDIVQKPLVVSNNDSRLLRGMKRIHTICHNAESINIKTAVCLVEDGESRVEHGHLEDLITLLLTSRETHIHLTLSKFRLHLNESHLLTHKFKEVSSLQRLKPLACTMSVYCSLHEICYSNSRYLHRILE